ncbi:MAG: LuxR C-terminal-related transcriptional regulator [Bacteroidota bacterium]
MTVNTVRLTARETEILRLLKRGMTSRQIAELLCRSVHTIEKHRENILAKLQARNTIDAIRLAEENGQM